VADLKKQLKEKDDLLSQGKTLVADLRAEVEALQADSPDLQSPVALGELQLEIIEEAKKITKNEVSSAYDLCVKTKELIKIESLQA